MRTARQVLALLILPGLMTASGCMDEALDGLLVDFGNLDFTSLYQVGGLPGPNASYAVFNIDSVICSGDSARIYAKLSVPGMNDSTAFLQEVSFNYWDELRAEPKTLNQTNIINDSIYFNSEGTYFVNSTLVGLTPNTSYGVCAVSARVVAVSDTLSINGWCNSFRTGG